VKWPLAIARGLGFQHRSRNFKPICLLRLRSSWWVKLMFSLANCTVALRPVPHAHAAVGSGGLPVRGAYYRGLRLKDMATIELAKVAVNDTGSTAVVTDNDDGTRYEISNAGLESSGTVRFSAASQAIEFALPRFRRQVTGGALSWITNGPIMTCQN
jgi:hypothetical protein